MRGPISLRRQRGLESLDCHWEIRTIMISELIRISGISKLFGLSSQDADDVQRKRFSRYPLLSQALVVDWCHSISSSCLPHEAEDS